MIGKQEQDSSNGFSMKRFVKLKGADEQLKLNPSAKVFREIELNISRNQVVIDLANVTKEAAAGSYRNGGLDAQRHVMTLDAFLKGDALLEAIEGESFIVHDKIIKIMHALRDKEAALRSIVQIIDEA